MYYSIHKQKIKLPGETVKGLGKYPLERDFPYVEELLEKYRPENRPSRRNGLFMRKTRNFKGAGATNKGFVHTLNPTEEPIFLEAYWVGVLQKRYPQKNKYFKQLHPEITDEEVVRNYWYAVRPPLNSKSQVEYVAKEAVVVHVSDEEVVVEPLLDVTALANSLPDF